MSEPIITKTHEKSLLCEEFLDETLTIVNEEEWSPSLQEHIELLCKDDKTYSPDTLAFTRQKDITEQMRTLLLDWLMEVSTEFFLKRETFYLAISHIDRLISSVYISRTDFQLIGITSLYVACKAEEIKVPKLQDFVKAASSIYPASSILSAEKKILHTLKWHMCPSTTYSLLNCVLTEWDSYILILFKDYSDYVSTLTKDKIKQQDLLNKRLETFKRENTYSYKRFREVIQILDASVLEFEHYKYKPWKLIAGLVYLMVNKCFFNNKYELLWWNTFVLGQENTMNYDEVVSIGTETVHLILEKFICTVFKCVSLDVLTGTLKYLNRFIEFNFCYNLPPVTRVVRNVQENYENFLSYQTYNVRNKEFIRTHSYKGSN
ncbi:hypothetical protein SteCoe_11690 [Stentor coeruleus]|uniref:Cyclin-like domain-containing protein n=1 Tax=Stentor coeruleus TaxID=5963 RepID=A0A1R2CCN1_9CILI|nr:hypothetical protein SteCoe_11690 [Stentor coeruleus]